MIMRWLLLYSFILPGIVVSQAMYQGVVVDEKTKEILPYVNIGIKDKGIGTVTDDLGNFQLSKSNPNEVITFSCIGYESRNFTGAELSTLDVIRLFPKTYRIPEITVSAKQFNSEERIFGVRNKTRGHSIGFGSAQLGTEIGALIYLDAPTLIKSAHFVINHAKGDSMLFRINIYDYHNGKIGDNLLQDNIFIQDKQRRGTIDIDMTAYDLILNRSVLLSLEWLRNFDEVGNKDMTFDTRKGKKLKGIYYKLSSNGLFEKLPYKKGSNPCFYFRGKQTK